MGTVQNPYAIAWSMKKKGAKHHYKDKEGKPEKKKKYKEKMGCDCGKYESFEEFLERKLKRIKELNNE